MDPFISFWALQTQVRQIITSAPHLLWNAARRHHHCFLPFSSSANFANIDGQNSGRKGISKNAGTRRQKGSAVAHSLNRAVNLRIAKYSLIYSSHLCQCPVNYEQEKSGCRTILHCAYASTPVKVLVAPRLSWGVQAS